jgi:hypothetical protein
MLLISSQQLLGKAKCSVFFRTKSQIDIYPFEGTTTYTRTTSEESIQHINARRLGGSWYGSVYVASDTGKGRDYNFQLSQSRKFTPVQVVSDHCDVLPTAFNCVEPVIICSSADKVNSMPW